MIATLEAGAHVVDIGASSSPSPPPGEPLRFGDRDSAAAFLRRYSHDWLVMRALRDLVADESALAPASCRRALADDEVLDAVAAQLVSRRLVAVARAREWGDARPVAPHDAGALDALVSAAAGAQPSPADVIHVWVLELKDSDGVPVPNARYVAIWPNGERREGRLNRDGTAELSHVPPDEPDVFYPEHFVEDPPGHVLAESGHPHGCARCC